jgi:hypothetical protein
MAVGEQKQNPCLQDSSRVNTRSSVAPARPCKRASTLRLLKGCLTAARSMGTAQGIDTAQSLCAAEMCHPVTHRMLARSISVHALCVALPCAHVQDSVKDNTACELQVKQKHQSGTPSLARCCALAEALQRRALQLQTRMRHRMSSVTTAVKHCRHRDRRTESAAHTHFSAPGS